jgi:nitronate monooxygenase
MVWIQVGTVSAALAASACHPDAIVLQGVDAGGHGVAHGASIISLLPETADALEAQGASNITLVAAGGIVDGRSSVAALALGASAVVMGTRFLGAEETNISADVREAVLETRDGGETTVRSKIFDEMWGSNSWPQIYDGRCLRNAAYDNITNGMSLAEVQKLFQQTLERARTQHVDVRDINSIWSGTGVGMVRKEEKAADIVRKVQEDTKRRLQNMMK